MAKFYISSLEPINQSGGLIIVPNARFYIKLAQYFLIFAFIYTYFINRSETIKKFMKKIKREHPRWGVVYAQNFQCLSQFRPI